jgi:hypothetical protein
MLTKSQAFIDCEEAGYLPHFYFYLSTDVARRCFTTKGTPVSPGDTGYYDGSGYVGDGGTYGAEVGIVQTRSLLLALPVVNKTVTQGMRGLITVLSASKVGYCNATYDNNYRNEDGQYFFSSLLTGPTVESFLNGQFEVRMGFQGIEYNDQLSLFRGKIMDSPLQGPVFATSADAVSGTLYDKWEVPRSSLYINPAQKNQTIPVVLGDMTENAAIDEDGDGTTDKGPISLVCIDTVNDVWAMACHALLTVGNGQNLSLYDDDGLIDPGDYTYTASNDYESVGRTIAYVTFSIPPTGTVTGAYKGAPDDAGALITNPIECVEKLLEIMDEDATFEATTFQEAKNEADEQGYTCAGIIIANNSKSYWIGNILSNFIGSWFINEQDEIVIQLDTGSENFLAVSGELKESLLKSPLKYTPSVDNLVTRPVIDYAISYSKIDRRFKNDSNASYLETYSNTDEAEDLAKPLAFDWTRNADTVETVADRIEALYGSGLKLYQGVRTKDFSLINWEPGDYFSFGTERQYDDDGNALKGQVGRVLNITFDLKSREITLDFYDTGNYLLAEPDYYDGRGWVGDGLTYGGERAS